MAEKTGILRAEYIYNHRNKVLAEMKQKEGHKLIGYLCCFAPPELITAAGLVPFRITGRPGEAITEANNYIEPYGCPYVRSCFEQTLKGRLDFLDGLVISHGCDMVQRIYGIWTYYRRPPYARMVNVPHQISPWSQLFFQRELSFFLESLEEFSGRQITVDYLNEIIQQYNQNRALVRQLYELQRRNPPLLKGSEILHVVNAGMTVTPDEFHNLLQEVLVEVQERSAPMVANNPRLLLWGSVMDHTYLLQLIEGAGAQVVVDDTCFGTRNYHGDVPLTPNPLEGLQEHYFANFRCPRTNRGPSLERFAYLRDYVREYNIQGVIGYVLSFCDPHKLDFPDLRDYMNEIGLPMLLIDDDYSLSNKESVKNRLQAFVEMLSLDSH